MKSLITLLSILFCLTVQAQLSVKDGLELRKMLLANVNELRDSLGLNSLKEEINLRKAALEHSKYMAKNRILTHDEKGPGRTPTKRVRRAGSRDFDIIGENVLFSGVDNFKFNKKELEELAREMYLVWRNSPPHYRNMSQQQYVFGDIGISADTKGKKIYATQVFGAKGVQVEGQISRNGFGVRASKEECNGLSDNLLTNFCNGIQIRNDSIFFFYHDISVVKRFMTSAKDGIAIDLIDREQMACGGPNILDRSKVYDGVMLKPVYRDAFFAGNTAEGEHRLITCLGTVPESMRGKLLAAGMIYIKNNEMCMYAVPAYAPNAPYVLEAFEPKLINPKIPLINKVITYTEELDFYFDRGAKESSNQPVLAAIGSSEKVHSLGILSYSSVEGSSDGNIKIHQERAKFIESYIRNQTKGGKYPVAVDAQENWSLMDFQLRYLFADSLLELSHAELKALIASGESTLDWDRLLTEQRSSKAFVNYFSQVDSEDYSDELPSMNLATAIVENNMPLANQALYEMYQSGYGTISIFDEQIFDALLKRKELVQNAAALFSVEHKIDRKKATMFVHSWASRLDELNQQAKENVLHLYSILGYGLVQKWDVSSKRLSNVIHPTRLEGLINTTLPREIMLNANLTFVYYYGHTLEQEGLDRSFAYVAEYMAKKTFTEEQLSKLMLFFNDWSRYDLTNEYLLKSLDRNVISDENVFILAHTLTKYQKDKFYDKYLEVMLKAQQIDIERWCYWLDEEFQILRDAEIKQMFCETCPN